MSGAELIKLQLVDPFRIGLVVFLILTMLRTRAATGVAIPLLAGALFIAVIIPLNGLGTGDVVFMDAVLYGLVSNAILIAIGMGILQIYLRLKGGAD